MVPLWFYLLTLGAIAACFIVARRSALLRERAARADREKEREALVGTIATGMAHELRNPLSTLTMNLQLLKEDWDRPVTEREQRGARKLEVLLRETRRLETVLNDFLRFAAGHKLNLDRVDLNALAGELLDFVQSRAERSGIRLRRDFAPTLPRVDADANLLRQSLLNLLINAQEAMPTGGDITVRTVAADGQVRLSVQDTGPGIPPENLARIFEIYFSTKPSGTGLGLPMARKIVAEHGGTLSVDSVPGRGATFTISLPALDETARR